MGDQKKAGNDGGTILLLDTWRMDKPEEKYTCSRLGKATMRERLFITEFLKL